MSAPEQPVIGIVGLGYVGLPLAVAFGRRYPTVGFDISRSRINALRAGHDASLEVEPAELATATELEFADDVAALGRCNVYIVTVPTPIDEHKAPDLSPLRSASRTVGSVLKAGDTVVYESTVYPGATEEVCVPILEAESGLRFNIDFFAGYSPERIDPGNRTWTFSHTPKVVSGIDATALDRVDGFYSRLVDTTRERLYDLVDGLPDDKLDEAEALLEQIAPGRNDKRVMRLEDAPMDDETPSEEEERAARKSRKSMATRSGISDEILDSRLSQP